MTHLDRFLELDLPAAVANQATAIGDELSSLWAQYTNSRHPDFRERLILQYRPLVKFVLNRSALMFTAVADYDDLLSSGTIGLIEAIERFDPSVGVKFENYAIARIRGAIVDAIRDLDHIPRSVRRKTREADSATQTLTIALGRFPTRPEIAAALDVKLDEYLDTLKHAARRPVSLELISLEDEGEIDSPAEDADSAIELLERAENCAEVRAALSALPERQQVVLSLYYYSELTMREISAILGVSESRVCQLHAKALQSMRREPFAYAA